MKFQDYSLEKPDIDIGFIPVTCASPLLYAHSGGYFKKLGLNVNLKLISGFSGTKELLIYEKIDAAHMPVPMPLSCKLGIDGKKSNLVLAAILNVNGQAITLANKHLGIKDVRDFKNFKIAVPYRFSMDYYLLCYYLAQKGLNPLKDLEIIEVHPPLLSYYLKKDWIDGFCCCEPYNQIVIRKKIGFIHSLSSEIWKNHPCCSLVFKDNFIKKYPNTYRSIIKALIQAQLELHNADSIKRKLIAKDICTPQYLNLPDSIPVEQTLTGHIINKEGKKIKIPERIDFLPWPCYEYGVWVLSQMQRWQQLTKSIDYDEIINCVFNTKASYEIAKTLGFKKKNPNKSSFSVMKEVFDPKAPFEYIQKQPFCSFIDAEKEKKEYKDLKAIKTRITQISKALADLSSGNLDVTLENTSDDEIGILENLINESIQTIKANHYILEEHNENLKKKIIERNKHINKHIKEINLHSNISKLVNEKAIKTDNFFREIVNLLPLSHQNSNKTYARITFENHEFKTKIFKETPWKIDSKIKIGGREKGKIEIFISNKQLKDSYFPREDEKAFLKLITDRIEEVVEKLEAQKALKSSQEKYKTLFETANEGILATELSTGKTILWNPVMKKMLGYTEEEMENLYILEIYPQKEWESVINNFEGVLLGEKTEFFGTPIKKKDGSIIYVNVNASKAYIENKDCIVGFFMDITNYQKAQKDLKKSEKRYRLIAENSNDVIITLDMDLNLKYISPSIKFLTGYTPEQFKVLGLKKILTSDSYNSLIKTYKQKINTINKITQDYISLTQRFEIIKKDSSTVWTEVKVSLIQVEDNKPSGILAVARDISERLKTEEALRESEEKLNSTLSSMEDLVFVIDKQGRFEDFHQPPHRLDLYVPPEEFLGKSYKEILPKELGMKLDEVFFELQRSNKVHQFDYPMNLKNKKIWYSVKITPRIDRYGNFKGATAVSRNITSRKKLEEFLQRENAKISAILSNMEEGLIFINSDDIYEEVNEYLCKFIGVNKDFFIGKSIENLYTDEIPSYIRKSGGKKQFFHILDFTFSSIQKFKKNPNSKTESTQLEIGDAEVIMRLKPIYHLGKYEGAIINIINVNEIVMARKQAEKSLKEAIIAKKETDKAKEVLEKFAKRLQKTNEDLKIAKQEAERANYSKSEFLANMSHEIRTPMNAIIGFSDVLMESNLSSDKMEYVSFINQSGKHLLDLINDILDLSKIEAGKIEINKVSFNIRNLIHEILTLLTQAFAKKNLYNKLIIDDNIPTEFIGDEKHIRQILLNLLSNAIKFTQKGSITISIYGSLTPSKDRKYFNLKISIKDTGIGIYPERLKSIFEPFDRGSKSISREYEGTGLGLSITKKIIESLNGKIKVESTHGKGSNFIIEIPLKIDKKLPSKEKLFTLAPQKESSSKALEERASGSKSKIKILLVEDNIANQKLVETYLKDYDYKIDTSTDGINAIEKASQENFDLILMDVQLPKMNGYEATKTIRKNKNYKKTPIIALTSYAMKNEALKAKSAGCTGYISKPVKKETLIKTIKLYLKKPVSDNKVSQNIDSAVLKLVPWFKESLKKDIKKVRNAQKEDDFDTIRSIGHQLKGCGSSYGFPEITSLGKKIEKSVIDQNYDNLKILIDSLEKEIKSL